MVNVTEVIIRTLNTANHILDNQQVVDAFGHISVRNPSNVETYFLSGYLAPGLVSSPSDIIEYFVSNSTPVDPSAGKGYSERFIHGEVLRRFPGVNSVVHSHAEAVLPYAISGVPLLPVFHMGGFLGTHVPVFDIAKIYNSTNQQDMLVSNAYFGEALAATFTNSTSSDVTIPENTVVLMRRHGFTTWGPDIQTAVDRAVYTKVNANAETHAMELRAAFASSGLKLEPNFELAPLTDAQAAGSKKMNEATQDKPWPLWVREVEVNPLYQNKA
ncbi:hypothetical protein EG327_009450 [Venturia inaequalis]|uniref:Class II aldolase/adducin N-terminal domain-containing protein n=1 Tax=Venturia inaequalis TaxID=5025 RepID=A0A8H3UM22_VENIN|nr:hypothetical protein EG327_009450 [Venturia inaequalis]